MKAVVKILFTVNILFTCGYSFAAKCKTPKASTPETGNSRSIASQVETIGSFISTDRSTEISDGVFLKSNKSIAPGDDRKVKDKNSPRYLDAVGKLRITNSEGKTNICGGSLVAFTPKQSSRIIVTSLHCMKGDNVTWESTTKDGRVIKRKVLKSLEWNEKSDYDILLLDKKVDYKDIPPLLIDYEVQDSPDSILGDEEYGNPEFAFAGFSADAELGKGGSVLTYDTTGKVSTASDSNGDPIGGYTSNVTTYGGASGGALIVTYTEEDRDFRPVNHGRQSYLMGIIKGGLSNDFASDNGVEGSHNTRFVYYERFMRPLYKALQDYNGVVEDITL